MIWDTVVEEGRQANAEVYDGSDKTVIACPIGKYSHYQSRFGIDAFPPGHFGENL